jgi:hypothetical protein
MQQGGIVWSGSAADAEALPDLEGIELFEDAEIDVEDEDIVASEPLEKTPKRPRFRLLHTLFNRPGR